MGEFPFGLQLPAAHALVVKSFSEAQAIHRFGVNLVLARRHVPAHRAAALHAISADRSFRHEARIELGCGDIEGHVCEAIGSEIARVLGREIAVTLYWFFVFARPAAATLRLTSCEAPANARFASDASSLRVVVTYSGLGLQWIPWGANEHSETAQSSTEEIAGPRSSAGPLNYRVVPPWWVAFIKGQSYAGNRGNGLMWRPSIAKPGIGRCMQLVLEGCS